MTRVIHTGDTHVGYRQYHSPERRQDYLAAFEQVVQDAVEDDVDAVVHAGDLFNDRRPDLQDLLGTIAILEKLRAADVPFLAIVGNHEDARNGQWLDLFERLGLATHLDREGTVIGDTAFYGLDFVPKSKRADLEYDFEPRTVSASALVGHGLFEPFPHGDWDLERVLEESPVAFDAVLLGDDHTPETTTVEDTWVTYCGSTERTSAAEREPRGYNLVEFGEDVSITRRGLETRDFVFIDVELAPSEGPHYILERIREATVEDAVVIVTVEGDGESITPAEIEEFGREQGALITRVNDRREVDEEAAVEVSFADPDDAVRERIREMGLSEAARSVDEVVRQRDIARSNVRSRVTDRVEELVDEEAAFEPVPESGIEADADGPAADGDTSPDEEPGTEASRPPGAGENDSRAASSPESPEPSETGAGSAETDGSADESRDEGEATSSGADSQTPSDDEADTDEEPRETTMEDFL
jgi:DNA repair exonuclease SbcCD nuclease subunit